MPKRYGITSDLERREKELKNEYSGFSNFKKECRFPNQESAQKWENTKKNQHHGGPKTSGRFYGYSHNYTKRKPQK